MKKFKDYIYPIIVFFIQLTLMILPSFFEISFSYNKVIQNELNFRTNISRIQAVLKLWTMRRLSIEGKIMVFK